MTKKMIINGETGSGKTYYSIHEAKKLGRFAYIAPCRQLAYEVYIDYATLDDTLSTGEVKLGGENNFYGVYESLQSVRDYDTILIDEAHFITDYDRGGHLNKLIDEAKQLGINVFLITATRNFPCWRGWNLIFLQPKFTPPTKVEVDYDTYVDRREAGVPTLCFKKYKDDAMLSADTLPSDRLKYQLDYRSGRISYVSATNVLAQGINMPCENLYIEYNPYEGDEILQQKLGRLGRMGFTQADEVTYCLYRKPKKIKKNRKKAQAISKLVVTPEEWGEFEINEHEVPKFVFNYFIPETEKISYKDIRYSKSFFEAIKKRRTSKEVEKITNFCSTLLETEENKIKEIILNNMR